MEYYSKQRFSDKEGNEIEERIWYTAGGRKTDIDLIDLEADAIHHERELTPEYYVVILSPTNMGSLPVFSPNSNNPQLIGAAPHIYLEEAFVKIEGAQNIHQAFTMIGKVLGDLKEKMEQKKKQSQIAVAQSVPNLKLTV